MLEIVQYIFGSFWHWVGAMLLVAVPCKLLIALIRPELFKDDRPKIKHKHTGEGPLALCCIDAFSQVHEGVEHLASTGLLELAQREVDRLAGKALAR